MISRDVVFVETELPGLGLGTSGPAYKPLASKPDAGGVGSAPDKPLLFNLGSGSDDDDTPVSAPDNHAMDPGSSSVPWPSRSSTPDNESDTTPTPRASPSPGPALHRSTHIKKPPVEFWKLPKDRTPPAPVPEADDKVLEYQRV